MDYRDRDFDGETVTLDNNRFTGCTFRNCVVRFGAFNATELVVCRFKENVTFEFFGAAALTVEVMRAFYQAGEGGAQLIENTFNDIRGI